MLSIDKDGVVHDASVKVDLIPAISHGPLTVIGALVVHQTDSKTAASTLAEYKRTTRGTGAHFLIDKDGTIYQTVSVKQKCWHVGPIYSRCYQRHPCVAKQEQQYRIWEKTDRRAFIHSVDHIEEGKKYPDRYPDNSDSIGIEIVGKAIDENNYEQPTTDQQIAIKWLVGELLVALKLQRTDVYRHPQLSRKNAGEARDANW
ncbi:peptidoglycan recognition protein family protein [Edaphobacter modestus]|uniref:N-acetylmuramoyl-L-alanine amidase n=1 Tax=Edaphobacter modestus TaxID=388466 RepID=A0A4Q7XZ74_9BACT|nr:peptidoglycan recognition family protein [Edaphobacter modestus]RZU29690.1 N-acetylmuramoyl-L-alanine amidase [Edaphobacter modestus]